MIDKRNQHTSQSTNNKNKDHNQTQQHHFEKKTKTQYNTFNVVLVFLVVGFMFVVVDCVLCSELVVRGLVFCCFVGACVRHYCYVS